MRLVLDGNCYKLNKIVIRRELDGYLLYLPMQDAIYFINQSAKEIIDILQNVEDCKTDIEEITKKIQSKYKESDIVNIQDIKVYVENLIELGIVS